MYLFALACQKPHFWTAQVVFHLLPRTPLKTRTCPENICTFSVLM